MITITEKEFAKFSHYIHSHYGIQLRKEKQALLTSRLQKMLVDMGFKNFSEYYEYIMADESGEAVAALIDKVSTNHTFFMREADHFIYFRDNVIPQLKQSIRDRDLRVWCAASATGEEPYTLAMILQDAFVNEEAHWDKRLLATDISQTALETAKKGLYSIERIQPLPAIWRSSYFTKVNSDQVEINNEIKREVIYRRFNLMDNVFPFKKKFHVIFCRNVMIYFDQKTKDQLIEKMYDQLVDGGYLFIGHSESINREKSRFKYIIPAVYRKLP